MSEYRRFNFVCMVLDALARGDEVKIDHRLIFRLDTSEHFLREECTEVRQLIEKVRGREPLSTDVVGELRALREAIVKHFDEQAEDALFEAAKPKAKRRKRS